MNRLIRHHDVILYTLLGMNKLVGLFISGVGSSRGYWQWLVHVDPREVKVWVDGPNLLKAVVEPFTIINCACINERLGSLVFHDSVNLGRLGLLKKGRQLLLYACLCFFRLFPLTGLLL